MNSRQGNRRRNTTNPPNAEPVGRPRDDILESQFMKKLRDGKIQMINAESEAELFSDKIRDINPEAIASRPLDGEEDNYSLQKFQKIRQWFKKKNPELCDKLYEVFKEGVNKFEYKEVLNQKDFPQFLFLDELDLSYVLHHILNSELPLFINKTEFSNEELLFLALTCFSLRDMISFKSIQILEQVHDQILTNMEGIKDKIKAHYQKTVIEKENKLQINSDHSGMEEMYQDNEVPVDLRKGEVHLTLQKLEEQEENENLKKEKKTKKIDKPDKKRGRPKNKNASNEPEDNLQNILNFLQKFITYISWSYRYIYSEELKKKKSLGLL